MKEDDLQGSLRQSAELFVMRGLYLAHEARTWLVYIVTACIKSIHGVLFVHFPSDQKTEYLKYLHFFLFWRGFF